MTDFIKIADQELAKTLAAFGFQYVKDGDCYAFYNTDELKKYLCSNFANGAIVVDNKLSF